jgi:hypothetical protein
MGLITPPDRPTASHNLETGALKRRLLWALRLTAGLAAIGLALLPILWIVQILATTGADNPSSDDGFFVVFVGRVLKGGYNWRNLLRDTFQNTHVSAIPALIDLMMAYASHFSIYPALYLSLGLFVAKLILVRAALIRNLRAVGRYARLLSWPVLSLLVFSISQISVFEHDFQAVKTAFNELGLALGVWALVRFPGRSRAVLLMAAGGLAASYSFGSGVLLFPVFIAGMLLLRFRKVWHYAVMLLAAAVGILPYVFFLLVERLPAESKVISLFKSSYIVSALGHPFINETASVLGPVPRTGWMGFAGVALLGIGLLAAYRMRPRLKVEQVVPSLTLIVFSLLCIWQISVFRGDIAPWYATFALNFWIGLIGLAYALCDAYMASTHAADNANDASNKTNGANGAQRIARRAIPFWVGAVAALIIIPYAMSHQTYADKSFFLRTRAPVSAACLRNYHTAPTYCEGTLVVWQVGNPGYLPAVGRSLEPYNLSVFGPNQEWTLQGDSMLDNVEYHNETGIPATQWSADLHPSWAHLTDYRHLNLFLHTGNWVSWTVTIPAQAQEADLTSAVAGSGSPSGDSTDLQVNSQVLIKVAGEPEELVLTQQAGGGNWRPFTISLLRYAGRTITIRLAATAAGGSAEWSVYRYPRINLRLTQGQAAPAGLIPSNTDLSTDFPQPSAGDFQLDMNTTPKWKLEGLMPADRTSSEASRGANLVIRAEAPTLVYPDPLDIPMATYTHFLIRISMSSEILPRFVQIYYKDETGAGFDYPRSVTIPLLADGEMHSYTFPIRLCYVPPRRITGLKIATAAGPSAEGSNLVRISDFRLIRRNQENRPATGEEPIGSSPK